MAADRSSTDGSNNDEGSFFWIWGPCYRLNVVFSLVVRFIRRGGNAAMT